MTSDLKTRVSQLCDALSQAYQDKGLTPRLRPALSAQIVEAMASSAGVQLGPELRALYQWRNGASGEPEQGFAFAGKAFLSLEGALAQRESMLGALHPKDRAAQDLRGLLPFAQSENEWYAIAGPAVLGHRPVFLVVEDAQPDFQSFEAMLETTLGWVKEPDWTPNSPPARAREIWYRHNPELDS